EKSGADILKMAVMPHGFEDVATIMEATNAMRQECEKPLVSMAMGSIGSITRISGENFGSGITFGTVGAASAPGQFPIGELRSLLDALHEKNEEDELKQ
ncbi:MAG: type I 3-dehydroquinate dehydratase, partial [Blautia faecis]